MTAKDAYGNTHATLIEEISQLRTERDQLKAQLERFRCFKCHDGNTPLYCLNCARDGYVNVEQLKPTIELLVQLNEVGVTGCCEDVLLELRRLKALVEANSAAAEALSEKAKLP